VVSLQRNAGHKVNGKIYQNKKVLRLTDKYTPFTEASLPDGGFALSGLRVCPGPIALCLSGHLRTD
ncbi:TPA: hypothetical protein ACXE9L_004275, partial [Citrobacter koseri]